MRPAPPLSLGARLCPLPDLHSLHLLFNGPDDAAVSQPKESEYTTCASFVSGCHVVSSTNLRQSWTIQMAELRCQPGHVHHSTDQEMDSTLD